MPIPAPSDPILNRAELLSRPTTTRPTPAPADFDDSQWEAIDAATLDQRRSTAKVCFNWYRINITVPEKVGGFSTAGSTVAFEIVIDDYAEVWVNGKMPRVLGQPGGPVVKGFNAPNRVILTRNAQPGQRIQLAVFGINGPISYSPQNFIWIKSATLDFYKSPKVAISETHGADHREGSGAGRNCSSRREDRETGWRIPVH